MSSSDTTKPETETATANRVDPEPDRRLGRFSVSRCCLAHWRDLAETVMRGTVVVGAEFDYAADCVRFTAFNGAFAHVETGIIPPEYVCRITRVQGVEDGDPPTFEVKWEPVPKGIEGGLFELLTKCDELEQH